MISRVPEDESAVYKKEQAKEVLSKMFHVLADVNVEESISLQTLLARGNITEIEYTEALKTAQRRTTIIMKRTPNDIHINNYNPVLLRALR